VKVEITNTLSIAEASKLMDIDEKTVLDMVKKGDIISIECGGTNSPTFYEIPEPEAIGIARKIKEEKERSVKEAEETDITAKGHKVLKITFPSPIKPVIVTYTTGLGDMTVEDVVKAACIHSSIDLDDINKRCSANGIYLKLKNLSFERVDVDGNIFLVGSVGFIEKPEEKTVVVNEKRDDLEVRLRAELSEKIYRSSTMFEAFENGFADFDDVELEVNGLKELVDKIRKEIDSKGKTK
jgi:uncharacterized protein YuzE